MINIGATVEIIANYGVSDHNWRIGTKAKVLGKQWDKWYRLKGIDVLWKSEELRKVGE